jgi:hypothetical protein
MVGPTQEDNMVSGRSSIVLAAAVLAVVQVATPAKAETWSFFPWFSPSAPEKPRVTGRIEQPAPVQVAPVQTYSPPAVRRSRVVVVDEPVLRPLSTHPFSRPYMIIGMGL